MTMYPVCQNKFIILFSAPSEFDFYFFHSFIVVSPHQKMIVREATKQLAVRYKLDFDKTLPTKAAQAQLHSATLDVITEKHPNVIVTESKIKKGNIHSKSQ